MTLINIKEEKIFTISEFVELLNIGLKASKVKITGEVSELKIASSGHVYFKMKDEVEQAVISCKIWARQYRLFGIELKQGMKIIAFGNPEIWAPRGDLSFTCETIELVGDGALKKQYDLLKEKLEKEGIFALENKREIPKYPQKIGVITSLQGAVIHDFTNNLGKFGFKVKMIDSRVEGQLAIEDLLNAIKTFRKKDIEVLVIIRGGGSMESLMAFNNELLVREVIGFPVPVVVGIGHDKDIPLICLAADKSESTPTAVANLLNESWEEALLFLERQEKVIFNIFKEVLNDAKLLILESTQNIKKVWILILNKYSQIENKIKVSIQKLDNTIRNSKINIENLGQKYLLGIKTILQRINEKLEQAEKIIYLNNPDRQLKMGYSITTLNGKIVRKINEVKIGQDIEIKILDGIIESEVKNIKSN